MTDSQKTSKTENQALFAKVFGNVTAEPQQQQANVANSRALTAPEWQLLARALQLTKHSSKLLQLSSAQDEVHVELRETVAHFLSGCSNLTTIIRECELCLQHLKKSSPSLLKWRRRTLQRQFLRHLRDKCYQALQSAPSQPQWLSQQQTNIELKTFFL